MFDKLLVSVGASATLILASSATLIPAHASEDALVTKRVFYTQAQAMTYDIGSKSIRGYYVKRNGACSVILMVTEKIDPEISTPFSAARLRLVLQPGAVAGLDSEEGRSLNITCGEAAANLWVDQGDTKVLTAAAIKFLNSAPKANLTFTK
jgi:hypothetical protein